MLDSIWPKTNKQFIKFTLELVCLHLVWLKLTRSCRLCITTKVKRLLRTNRNVLAFWLETISLLRFGVLIKLSQTWCHLNLHSLLLVCLGLISSTCFSGSCVSRLWFWAQDTLLLIAVYYIGVLFVLRSATARRNSRNLRSLHFKSCLFFNFFVSCTFRSKCCLRLWNLLLSLDRGYLVFYLSLNRLLLL